MRSRPMRYWFSISSPTERTRRLPRLSMSSIWPRPSFSSLRIFTVRSRSSLRSTRIESGTSVEAQPHVHLHPADRRQIVAVAIEEQSAEQPLGRLRRRRLARTHHAIDVDQRVVAVGVLVHRQRVADPRPVRLIDRQRRQLGDAGLLQRGELRLGEFLAGLGIDLAGFLVHQVLGHEAAEQIGAADQHFLGLLGDAPRLALRQLGVGIGHHLAGLGVDDRLQQLDAAERVGIERPRPALRRCGRTPPGRRSS